MTSKKRPEVLSGRRYRVDTPCGKVYLIINHHEGEVYEVLAELGKGGSCVKNLYTVISVLISVLLQSGIPTDKIKKTIKKHILGINCGERFIIKGKEYCSCVDWIGNKLLEEMDEVSKKGAV